MGDGEDAPTGVAPTELGSAIEATEVYTAWGLEPPEPEREPRLSPRRITSLALAVSLVLLAGAGALAVWQIRQPILGHVTLAAPPKGAPTASSSKPASGGWLRTGFPDPPAPPTATVTVERTVPAPAPTAAPVPVAASESNLHDERFLANIRRLGWVVFNPWIMTNNARVACGKLHSGSNRYEVAAELVRVEQGWNLEMAKQFLGAAQASYPDCP